MPHVLWQHKDSFYNKFFHSRVTQLVIFSANVAIPTFLIKKKDGENVMFVVYVQVDEAYLSKDNLEHAIMVTNLS